MELCLLKLKELIRFLILIVCSNFDAQTIAGWYGPNPSDEKAILRRLNILFPNWHT